MNRVKELFGIKYPIIQGGMIWCSGWELASAVSNAGGLGLIGSGSMYPEVLRQHIKKCQETTNKPFGVNIPLLYSEIDKHINIVIEENVKIVFTSAGNPNKYTSFLQSHGIIVVHVIASTKFALKSVEAGVDAIVAEGFEAGGHNGVDETTTMCLIPKIAEVIDVPFMAAGGIGSGKSMLAAFALGAEGVQIGSRFAVCKESSAHTNFKQIVFDSSDGGTELILKEITPVRMLKNGFYKEIKEAYINNATKEELKQLLGRGRAKKGIFEGDVIDGELEIGQVSAMINKMQTAAEVINQIISEFNAGKSNLVEISF